MRARLRSRWIQVYVGDTKTSDAATQCSTNDISESNVSIACRGTGSGSGSNGTSSSRSTDKKVKVVVNKPANDGTNIKPSHSANVSHPYYQAYHTCEESAAYVAAIRSEALELKESIRASGTLIKALRKLTSLNWVLCYERLALPFLSLIPPFCSLSLSPFSLSLLLPFFSSSFSSYSIEI